MLSLLSDQLNIYASITSFCQLAQNVFVDVEKKAVVFFHIQFLTLNIQILFPHLLKVLVAG